MKNKRIYILAECAVMLALSVALSFLKIWQMPLQCARYRIA